MARYIINQHRTASILLNNGTVLPVPCGWTGMSDSGGELLFRYADGSELWVADWAGEVAGFNVQDLEDGEAWADLGIARRGNVYMVIRDGSEWTRHGDEMVVWTPSQGTAQAA